MIIGDSTATFTLTVANSITRDLGSLVLAKSLTGGPTGYTGPFTINYDCGLGYTGSVSVAAGGSQTVSGIPTGTSCIVSEPTLPSVLGYSFGTPTFSPADATVTIPYDGARSVTVTTNNTLTRDLGSLVLAKSLTGGPTGYTGPFIIHYDCGTGFIGDATVNAGSSATISYIPTGTSCTVSEPTLPTSPTGYTFGSPTFSPADATVTIPYDGARSVTVTTNNTLTRNLGNLKLMKSLTGGPADYLGPFTIHYDCGTFGSDNRLISVGGFSLVTGIPTGTSCTVSEPTLPSVTGYTFGTPTFSPSATVTIPDIVGVIVDVTTNNTLTRDLGSLVLAKALTGGPAGYTGPFTINYDCGTSFTGSVSVAAGSSQTVSGIPTGTSCTVSETLPTAPTGYTFGTPTFDPGATVTILAGNGSSVTVTTNNTLTRDTGSLQIAKTLSNPDGAPVPASFLVDYDCGTGYTDQVTVAPGSPATVNGIPTGNVCTVTEVAPAAIPGYTWGAVTYTPTSVTIDTKGGTFSITVANSITRDRGTLTIVKKVINDYGGTATVNAFGLYTSAGSLTFDSGVANGTTTTYTSQTITVVTNLYTLKENDIYGYTEGSWSCTGAAGAVVPTFNNGSVQVGKGENVICTITNNDQPGTIIIKKITKPVDTGSFAFTTTGGGYDGFTLPGGQQNSQTNLSAGSYTVTESTQLGWILTGIGGSTDPATPYACTVTGSGGSSGTGDLDTQTATINLKNGDTVTCVFENTGMGVTRTQGFWATHPQLANIAWFGGTEYGHTFPGVANTVGIGDKLICGQPVDTLDKLMGAFWSDISKTSTGTKRSSLGQAQMQLLQQLIAAELNASAFGSAPINGTFTTWENALCGKDTKAIQTALQQAASFNTNGDSGTFTPGTSANSKLARSIADKKFWDMFK